MPSLTEVWQQMLDAHSMALNTALPGEVVKYDADTGKAEVRALIRMKYTDGTILTPPVIPNVPILLPRTQGASLTLPIAPGDPVLLVFAQRSIDRWLSEGGEVDAGDARTHAMSDAFAIPGAFSFKAGTTGETGTVLKDGNTKVKLTGEKVAIGNSTAELLEQIVDALDAIATSTAGGTPTLLSNAADITTAKEKIESIKGSI